MPAILRAAQTEGSSSFDPDQYFDAWAKEEITPPYDNDFRKFIIKTFGLQPKDDYAYRATAEVTLLQAQTYLEMGAQGGLLAWYKDAIDETRSPPTASDIAAYTDIFRATTNTTRLLIGLESNAKKNSIRLEVARHLRSLNSPPDVSSKPYASLAVSRNKEHVNPYFDIWAWSNQVLGWAGPEPKTAEIKFSHAVLPVLYHHFGCICPSYESLSYIEQIAGSRPILDVGSGNGYWAYMLRRIRGSTKKGPLQVSAIDNGISEWRTMWISDTIEADGAAWLSKNNGGKDAVLMLIYPSVGNDFTNSVIQAYKGRTIICAGSQNANGFTAFADQTIAEWISSRMPVWRKIMQIPLPSFAGKDEALFVFEQSDAA